MRKHQTSPVDMRYDASLSGFDLSSRAWRPAFMNTKQAAGYEPNTVQPGAISLVAKPGTAPCDN